MNHLQSSPEPVVRVQDLSESGLTKIPDRYIKPVTDRPSPKNLDDTHIDTSVIDLQNQLSNNQTLQYETLSLTSSASKEWGFFLHYMPASLRNQSKWPAVPQLCRVPLFSQSPFVILAVLICLSQLCRADIGTSAHYRTPYLPTACYGNNAAQFPSSNLFASAGEGIWDNGAACGRQYLVRCISAAQPRTCFPGQTIRIRIVDRALSSVSRPSQLDATIVLSETAFGMIAKPSASYINIEFQQV